MTQEDTKSGLIPFSKRRSSLTCAMLHQSSYHVTSGCTPCCIGQCSVGFLNLFVSYILNGLTLDSSVNSTASKGESSYYCLVS